MIEMDSCFKAHRSLLVVGYGVTGKALIMAALELRAREQLETVALVPGMTNVHQISHELDELITRGVRVYHDISEVDEQIDIAVVSPGISPLSDLYQRAQQISGELMSEPEFAWRLRPESWIAITGTNGKTTTTSLVHHLLCHAGIASKAAGNIGQPCISAVMENEPCVYVAELSSYQLHSTSQMRPNQAAIINITPDHLAWHGSHEAYAAAKTSLIDRLTSTSLAVLNVDDASLSAYVHTLVSHSMRMGVVSVVRDEHGLVRIKETYPQLSAYAGVRSDGMLVYELNHECHELCLVDQLNIAGDHNLTNALIAALLAADAGCSSRDIAAGLQSFMPLEHRLEPVATVRDVLYVNDSKATNTDAALQALTAFPHRHTVVLLGGADKGTSLEEFAKQVAQCCKAAICFGAAKKRFSQALIEAAKLEDITLAECDTLRDALLIATQLSAPGDVVILSPACASFDEFTSFEHRGQVFKELVREYAAQEERSVS